MTSLVLISKYSDKTIILTKHCFIFEIDALNYYQVTIYTFLPPGIVIHPAGTIDDDNAELGDDCNNAE